MRRELGYALAGRAGATALTALFRSARFAVEGRELAGGFFETGRPVLFAVWHSRLLPFTYYLRDTGIAVMVSRSKDGEYISRVIEHWGYTPVRGSSSRGGTAALREIVREARKGAPLAFTPDGPRGPKQQLKPGVLLAAQLTGLPVVPMTASADRAWWPEGWDRFLVPKPFSRVRLAFGEAIPVPRDADAAALERIGTRIAARLDSMTERLDAEVGAD